MGSEFSEYSESYLGLNVGQLTLQQTAEQTGQNKRSPHSAIVCSGTGGTAFVSQTRRERKSSCSVRLTVGWNTDHQTYSGAIHWFCARHRFFKTTSKRVRLCKKEGQQQWSLQAWHDGGQVVGLNGGRCNNTKNLLSFPTGVEVSQESITIQTQVRDKRATPLFVLWLWRGQESLLGGRRCLQLEDVNPALVWTRMNGCSVLTGDTQFKLTQY